jgi:integrase
LRARSKKKADRIVRRTLADGTVKEYRYKAYRPKPRLPADSLDALIRAYRRSPEWDALKPHTRAVYAIYLRPLEQLGHIPVRKFSRRDLLTLRDAIAKARGNGAGTGFMRSASTLFTWAVDRDWIEHSPVYRVKNLAGGHLRAWTLAEAEAAAAALPEPLRRVVILARYTGQRRGDLVDLGWSAYDGATIRLVQQKTGERLALPVHPVLKAELDAWRPGATATTILTNTLGRPWKPQHLSHQLPVALARIGLPADLNVHGLRKLAATELAEAGCSTHEIAAITGHRTLAMVALYTRSVEQEGLAGSAVVKLFNRTILKKRENS